MKGLTIMTTKTMTGLAVTTALLLAAGAASAKPRTTSQRTKTRVAQATTVPASPPPPATSPSSGSAPAPTAPATGQGTKEMASDPALDEARTRYARGVSLYNEGDFKLALIEFQRSYELSPNWRILYNIGEVHFQLNNYAAALQALEKYESDGAKEIPDARRAEVDKDIDALRSRTGRLTIVVNVPGADVMIGDNPVGKSPMAADTLVDAGDLRVTVNKPGYRSATQSVRLAGREKQTVRIDLVEEKVNVVVASTPEEQRKDNAPIIVGWAATGAFAAGAVVTGVLALNAKSDLDKLQSTRDITRGELDAQQSKMRNFGIATDVLTGAAVVAGGVSLWLTLRSSGSTEKQPAPATVQAGITPRGVALSGTF